MIIGEYLEEYSATMRSHLKEVPWSILAEAYKAIFKSERIFVCGNGGSAAIANHLETDFSKAGIAKVKSLSANSSILTMLANDSGYQNVFSEQLTYNQLNSKDLVILISSSGNSPNIISALTTAHLVEANTIGLSGFDGGLLNKAAKIAIHIPAKNYGIVEDAHQAIMHVLTQWFIKEIHGS